MKKSRILGSRSSEEKIFIKISSSIRKRPLTLLITYKNLPLTITSKHSFILQHHNNISSLLMHHKWINSTMTLSFNKLTGFSAPLLKSKSKSKTLNPFLKKSGKFKVKIYFINLPIENWLFSLVKERLTWQLQPPLLPML